MAESEKPRQPAAAGESGRTRKKAATSRRKAAGTRTTKSSASARTTRKKKTTAGKATRPDAPGAKSTAPAPKASTPTTTRTTAQGVSADERHRMVAEAAYLRAARRNFAGGDPRQDWLDAESEIDARLLRGEQDAGA